MNSLKALREENHITQKQPAKLCGVSLRTYQRYESDPGRENSQVYEAIENRLNEEY